MIFVTVGTQLPFDRLIRAVDEIAPYLGGETVIAQTNGGKYIAHNIGCRIYLSSEEFDRAISQSRLIVSHAGIGTIISALMQKKPIIIMPRMASLGEHRNEHQIATAMKMNELQYVNVAYDNKQLQDMILYGDVRCLRKVGNKASKELIESLTNFIFR